VAIVLHDGHVRDQAVLILSQKLQIGDSVGHPLLEHFVLGGVHPVLQRPGRLLPEGLHSHLGFWASVRGSSHWSGNDRFVVEGVVYGDLVFGDGWLIDLVDVLHGGEVAGRCHILVLVKLVIPSGNLQELVLSVGWDQ